MRPAACSHACWGARGLAVHCGGCLARRACPAQLPAGIEKLIITAGNLQEAQAALALARTYGGCCNSQAGLAASHCALAGLPACSLPITPPKCSQLHGCLALPPVHSLPPAAVL